MRGFSRNTTGTFPYPSKNHSAQRWQSGYGFECVSLVTNNYLLLVYSCVLLIFCSSLFVIFPFHQAIFYFASAMIKRCIVLHVCAFLRWSNEGGGVYVFGLILNINRVSQKSLFITLSNKRLIIGVWRCRE